ncbi:hypothetical protein GCK72_021065 [Caenorhabditis remanei]|uniref:Uncharacterized protein n=1 Tax=Caenorhabditis remanei TaxID=31234 RepID=A0A6A5GJ09_CAERE|nr:hypothetical protein GCK72_021065 [Caenorhabditis remanei]KAF1754502.1 hypothetical protein GCK72_021065 [Caenorhabditis remanei]
MSQPIFQIGESFVCIFKTNVPYEAKVIGIKEVKGKQCYVIHYTGWASRHDEKVQLGAEEGKMFKGTLEEYARTHNVEIPTVALNSAKKKRSVVEQGNQSEESDESSDMESPTPGLRFDMASPLKKIIIDDSKYLKSNVLTHVPAAFSIDEIVSDYLKTIPATDQELQEVNQVNFTVTEDDPTPNSVLAISAQSLVQFFDVVLGFHLLYPNERKQYNDLVHKVAIDEGLVLVNPNNLPAPAGFKSSEHYGLIHFLRMFTKLPKLLEESGLNLNVINRLTIGIESLLEFLERNFEKYYNNGVDYDSTAAEEAGSSASAPRATRRVSRR